MHLYEGAVDEHPHSDRAGFLADIEDSWCDRADPMGSFDLGGFRDDVDQVR